MTLQPNDFYGPGIKLQPEAICNAASSIQVDPVVLMAIMAKETNGDGVMPDGRPKILFEPHVFHHLTKGAYDQSNPELSVMWPDVSHYGPGGQHQYDKLFAAMALNYDAAVKSASYGFWQCMGFNYAECGFDSPDDMILSFVKGEPAQLAAWITFLKADGLIPALQAKDWQTIAYKFNGPEYKVNHYDTDLANFYKQRADHIIQLGSTGPLVVSLQKLLNASALPTSPLKTDGVFGPDTEDVLKDWQQKKGIIADGIAGPQTFASLATDKVDVTPPLKSKRIAAAVVSSGAAVGSGAGASLQWSDLQNAASSPTAQKAYEQIIAAGSAALVLDGFLIGVILAMAAYIVWTKLTDYKQITGGLSR